MSLHNPEPLLPTTGNSILVSDDVRLRNPVVDGTFSDSELHAPNQLSALCKPIVGKPSSEELRDVILDVDDHTLSPELYPNSLLALRAGDPTPSRTPDSQSPSIECRSKAADNPARTSSVSVVASPEAAESLPVATPDTEEGPTALPDMGGGDADPTLANGSWKAKMARIFSGLSSNSEAPVSGTKRKHDESGTLSMIASPTPSASRPGPNGSTKVNKTHAASESPDPVSSRPTTDAAWKENAEKNTRSNWQLVHPLFASISGIPVKGHVQALLALPRLRKVKFNRKDKLPLSQNKPRNIGGLVLYMVGHVAPSPCSYCTAGSGIFVGCIILPPYAPSRAHKRIHKCANCVFDNIETCLPNPEDLDISEQSDEPGRLAESEQASDGANKGSATPRQLRGRLSGQEITKSSSSRQLRNRSGDISHFLTKGQQQSASVSASQAGGMDSTHRRPTKLAGEESSKSSSTRELQERDGDAAQPPTKRQKSSASSPGHGVRDRRLSVAMEDWEVTPGRISHETGQRVRNIAYSTSYLAHSEEVTIAPGICFNVLVIKAGTNHRWNAVKDKTRIFSVAAGKISVKMLDKEFDIGPNGVVTINEGTVCIVQNTFYSDATLHVTSLHKDDVGTDAEA